MPRALVTFLVTALVVSHLVRGRPPGDAQRRRAARAAATSRRTDEARWRAIEEEMRRAHRQRARQEQ
jgi:hypothetical protein